MAYKQRASTDSISVGSMFYARGVMAVARRRERGDAKVTLGLWMEQAIHELDKKEKREQAEIDFREMQIYAAHNRDPSPDREQFFKMRGLL